MREFDMDTQAILRPPYEFITYKYCCWSYTSVRALEVMKNRQGTAFPSFWLIKYVIISYILHLTSYMIQLSVI